MRILPVATRCPRMLLLLAAALFSTAACSEASKSRSVGKHFDPLLNGRIELRLPGVVGMSQEEPGHFFQGHCTGTLIADNLVLTAAHCVLSTADPFDPSITCGQNDQLFTSEARQYLVSVEAVRPLEATDASYHRGFDVRAAPSEGQDAAASVLTTVCGSDVALLVLADNVPASDAIPLVPRIDTAIDEGESFSALGFGVDGLGADATAGVRMRSDDNNVLCVGDGCRAIDSEVFAREWLTDDARVCPGDSGGPALDTLGRVIGVASRGFGGCDGVIYGDVSAWRDFITTTTLAAAELGGYEPPGWATGESTEQAALAVQEAQNEGVFVLPPEPGCSLSRRGSAGRAGPALLVLLGFWAHAFRRLRRRVRPST